MTLLLEKVIVLPGHAIMSWFSLDIMNKKGNKSTALREKAEVVL